MILKLLKRAFQTPDHDTEVVARLTRRSKPKDLNTPKLEPKTMPRRKTTKKSRVGKKQIFGGIHADSSFVLKSGKPLRSVYELIDALETMHQDTYKHHVSEDNNDFANWVRDCFDEPGLASHMEKMRDQQETQKVLLKHMVRELSRLKS
ncbi:MAG: hypothetical protein QF486_05220 [Candidatus Woesearchaeota archaeon]|jgi:hypothetical protein|nr:hypothetical protein [Candidatus Woesearchaeota archaeon]MDP7181814.1 hypothetical protein [Candidatus Woesearchaeota archaeon]MDP7198989.1 hypothetical protein [Candidatus Woesearchaeota archaeon]MDP7467967.1 hypothetical protein [Candidatus Woesearchaeota archaeon]MDP7647758.1 hypothetical protein [Candidatus Woesearchaeota archaeon]|tara:strand:+ start:2669 stop:3115 length:447 start_codon:yes stop_codon:yes gene_type:complete